MITKEQKTRLYEIYSRDVWKGDAHMSEYCVKKTAALAVLPGGELIPIEKQNIKKDFCFGYSDSRYDTEDYDRANRAAEYAAKSVDYFKEQNMQDFREVLDTLKEQSENEIPRDMCVIRMVPYYGQPETSPLKGLSFVRSWAVLEAHDYDCNMSELIGGEAFNLGGQCVRVPSVEELQIIISAYEEAAKDHEKKVNNYLKKYGLSKVRTWSYWQDE